MCLRQTIKLNRTSRLKFTATPALLLVLYNVRYYMKCTQFDVQYVAPGLNVSVVRTHAVMMKCPPKNEHTTNLSDVHRSSFLHFLPMFSAEIIRHNRRPRAVRTRPGPHTVMGTV